MGINPNNPNDLHRLQQAIEHSRRVLEPHRNYRQEFIKEFAGSRYNDNGPKYKKLVNLLNQTVETFVISLVAGRPRASISTRNESLKFFAHKYGVHLNNLVQEIRLEDTLRGIVLDAYFAIGISKTFMGESGEQVQVEVEPEPGYHGNPFNPTPESIWVDPGKPYVERVSLDDWFHDTLATRWDQIKFCGNYYRIAFEKLKDPMYDQEVASKLRPSRRYDNSADDDSYERASDLTQNEQDGWDESMDMIDLVDIWLPYEKLIVTCPRQSFRNSKPLAVRKWNGPEQGPFRILGFLDVPDNLMPSAPAQNIQDLEGLFNSLLRKLERQAKRQKKLVGAPEQARKDLERAKRRSDGDSIYLADPSSIKEFSLGGIDQTNLAFAIQISQMFNKAAGNPDALAGLGAQSETASQDQMVQEAASRKLAKMQEQTVKFTAGIMRDLGWLLWVDAYKKRPGKIDIPDAGISVQADWTPEEREGDFEQYLFDVEPYSMAYKSPSQRATQLTELVQGIYMPSLQMMQQQGGSIDFQVMTEVLSELYDLPRLKEIVKFSSPPTRPDESPQGALSMDDGGAPGGGNGETIRRNIPTGGTQQSRENVMMQTLLAGEAAPINQDQMNSASQGGF